MLVVDELEPWMVIDGSVESCTCVAVAMMDVFEPRLREVQSRWGIGYTTLSPAVIKSYITHREVNHDPHIPALQVDQSQSGKLNGWWLLAPVV